VSIDKTRTSQEQKVANLFRLLGFSLKTDFRPKGREFDVYAVLGPLTIAVECKDFAESTAGKNNIEEFSEKRHAAGNLIGVFVANRFSSEETALCIELGIEYWETSQVDKVLKTLREGQHNYKHIQINMEILNLLSAIKKFVYHWSDYIEDWVVQREITDTLLFEEKGLIKVNKCGKDFSYSKTRAGKDFFKHLLKIKSFLVSDEIGEWEDRYGAAFILENACSWDDITAPNGFWDRMILSSMGIHKFKTFQLTKFGSHLKDIVAQIIANSKE